MENTVEKVVAESPLRTAKLDWAERIVFAAAAVAVLVVFSVAWWLHPDPRGLGTHQQLGLMPCLAVRVLHIPCPFCGMTTSFSYFAHGDPADAARTQPAGALLFICSALGCVLSAGFAVSGRWFPILGEDRFLKRVLQVGAVIIALAWIYKIIIYRF